MRAKVPQRFRSALHQQPGRTGPEDDEGEGQNIRRLPNAERRRRLRASAIRHLDRSKAALQHPERPHPDARMAPRRIGALNPAAIPAFQSIRPTEAPRRAGAAWQLLPVQISQPPAAIDRIA